MLTQEKKDDDLLLALPTGQGLTTCIVGGGNSAHVLIPFLTEAGHNVNILTRKPEAWHGTVTCELTDGLTGHIKHVYYGRAQKASSQAEDVVPQADIIIFCMPVHQCGPAIDRIAPHLSRSKSEVHVGTIFGQAGFNWMVHAMEREHAVTNIVCFAIGQIPWICRALEYGKRYSLKSSKKRQFFTQLTFSTIPFIHVIT